METLASPATPDTAFGWQTVEDVRRLLRALGADDDLLRRIVLRTDLGDRQYVSIPPLPVALIERLVLRQPGEVPTC
jgi:hypothetical protein